MLFLELNKTEKLQIQSWRVQLVAAKKAKTSGFLLELETIGNNVMFSFCAELI